MKRIIPFLFLAFAFAACQDEGPTVPTDDALFAKGGDKGKPDKFQWVPLSVTFRDDGTDGITSDGRGPYEHEVCGVRAGFPPNPGGDAIMGTERWPIKPKDSEKCGGRDPRWITMDLGDDGIWPANFVNVDSVQAITEGDGVVERKAVFLIKDFCTLWFDKETYPGSSNVEVWQNPDGTWTAQSWGSHVAYCKDGVRSYYLPFGLMVSLMED
jgi:hypothetical protein